jgi:drug/metabolite transporter (DMT)-like permease
LGAAFVWTFSSLLFTNAGRRVGALIVNRARLAFATLLVGVTHWLLQGQLFPVDAEPMRFFWLSLSALIGLVIGDTLMFQCYVLIGTRIGVLLFTLSPVFGTLLAWITLGESLSLTEGAAMGLTLGGVMWVVLERGQGAGRNTARQRDYVRGILFGAASNLCYAVNLVVVKKGVDAGFPPLSAVMIRMTAGMVIMWGLALAQGEFGRTIRRIRAETRAAWEVLGGALVGTFLGMWLSTTAVQAARVGIASTLMALTPVFALPLARVAFHERVTWRAVVGTLVALAGVALMFLG